MHKLHIFLTTKQVSLWGYASIFIRTLNLLLPTVQLKAL